MSNQSTLSRNFAPRWLQILIITLLVLGIFLRFYNIEKKVYWKDETLTSLTISGYSYAELAQEAFNGRVIGLDTLAKFQAPNQEKGLIDTIKSLGRDFPEHPPLYYVMVRYWAEWFGNSVGAIRSLSALISLLVFPLVYWLCLEIFESSMVAWVAIGLIAVSPFYVLYAQEAREYSLWMVTILISSISLLKAMKLKTKLNWATYAATAALGLYTFPFSGLVIIGHGIYVVGIEGFRLSRTVISYLLAALVGLLAYTPWLLIVLTNLSRVNRSMAWTSQKESFLLLIKRWLGNLSRIFFDFGFDSRESLGNTIILLPLILIMIGLVGYSIYSIWLKSTKQVWLFILTLIFTTPIALILPDLILGGRRSGTARYLIPCYLGIQLAVSYLLAKKITSICLRGQQLWRLVLLAVVSIGLLSCGISSQSQVWWNKGSGEDPNLPQIAHIINQFTSPLLISDTQQNRVMALSYFLNPKVKLQLVIKPNVPVVSEGFNNIFLFSPSDTLRYKLEKEQNFKIEPINDIAYLWRMKKKL